MKKSFFYIAGLAMASFGVFAAFSDPATMTDEQKVEAKFQEKVTAFNSQKDAECKANALTEAQNQFTPMADAAIAAAAVPLKPGQKPKTPTKPSTGGSQVTPTPTPTPTVTTTTTTTKPTDPNKDRGGATTTTTQKDRGGATTTTTQKDRGGATKTGN